MGTSTCGCCTQPAVEEGHVEANQIKVNLLMGNDYSQAQQPVLEPLKEVLSIESPNLLVQGQKGFHFQSLEQKQDNSVQ